MQSNIETYLRLKPILYEKCANKDIKSRMIKYEIDKDNNKIEIQIPNEYNSGYINNSKKSYEFKFTGIFEPDSTQEEIFNKIGNKIINSSLEGYNSTLFCYGQTGSGKTYTICGKNSSNINIEKIGNSPERGIIPRLLISFFDKIRKRQNKNIDLSYSIYISYLEIYNENAYDLFDKSHYDTPLENWKKIIVYQDNYGNIIMKNMSMIKVENEEQALDLLQTGNYIRHSSSTSMNLASSRSHAIFSIIIEGKNNSTDVITVSKINLVDLAGSERLKIGNKKDAIYNETKYINLSLSFLEQVIVSLSEKDKGKISHIPYRNSLMTTILKDSLGGNCKTILIANASSDIKYIDETLSTMRFALRCAKVKNEISKNEHIDLTVLINQLQTENLNLKKKLNENNKNLPYLNQELSEFEKDECKILISDYLNEKNKGKKIKATNVNQLLYIIDFLIEYINNKEKSYKEKMTELLKENDELIRMAKIEEEKYKKINNIINKNNLGKFFVEEFNIKEKNFNFNSSYDKMSFKTDNNINEFNSSLDSDNMNFQNLLNSGNNLMYSKTYNKMSDNVITSDENNTENKKHNNGIVYCRGKILKTNSFSLRKNNNKNDEQT